MLVFVFMYLSIYISIILLSTIIYIRYLSIPIVLPIIYLSFYVCISYQSIDLPVYPSVYLSSVYHSLMSLFIHLSNCLSLRYLLYLTSFVSLHLSDRLYVCEFFENLSIYLIICQIIYHLFLIIYQSINVSVILFFYLTSDLSLFVYQSIFLLIIELSL